MSVVNSWLLIGWVFLGAYGLINVSINIKDWVKSVMLKRANRMATRGY